jgi:Fe-S-cluster containining protein
MSDTAKKFSIVIDSHSNRAMEITVPDEPLRLVDIVPLVHRITDQIVQSTINHSEQPVTCSKGCGVCCKQLVPLSIPEVFFIVDRLLKMPLTSRTKILTKFDSIEKILNNANFTDILRTIDQTKDDRNIAQKYFHLGLDCPFLEQGACAIHLWRPVVCREFNSLSDPSLCSDPFKYKVKALSYPQRPSAILAKLYSSLTDSPPVLAPTPLLFEIFEKHEKISNENWASEFLIQKMLDLSFE